MVSNIELILLDALQRGGDAELSKGLNTFLTTYWGKDGKFKKESSAPFVKQHDAIVCSFMALCRLMLKLTGATLDATHWKPCVGIIRCFFDLHLFLDAEKREALRKGCIEDKLREASNFWCTLTHSEEDAFTNGKKRSRGGKCEKLEGIVYNLPTERGTFCFSLECQIVRVPRNGSCMLAAAARALARLDIDSLKKNAGLKELDWGSVDAWRTFGRDLINGNDDNPDGAPERSGTPGSDSIGPRLDSTPH
jgi:hypothetical protein